ncbi:MAG TPA: arginine--tRNA ligase [Candidatus Marinimicrobia bacterium]|mgnify:FL=1|nr:arginine--tRNA ligase [Candidatus Neomarinimicrobiota bacterium]HRS51920.1 arginine--tRNA ligase [Candidatus Neomarinimicrobiota bacterium]HRU93455.1 arginine--tRNA ligase [Candidatus Neomarinimicrobiota bacterium]
MIEYLRGLLEKALQQNGIDYREPIQIERPKQETFGHYTTNLALALAKVQNQSPLAIAEKLIATLPQSEYIEYVEYKAPGFINFFLSPRVLQQTVAEILNVGENYGKLDIGKNQRVQVEFVSANPTGPLTVGHGRQAVLGDTVARILEWVGYRVDREYYYNDAGRQMRILGHSVYWRYRQLLGWEGEFPEDHYQGEYIVDIAREVLNKYGDSLQDDPDHEAFRIMAEERIFADIKQTLERLGVVFDSFYNEKSLYENGQVNAVLEKMKAIGASYEKDGAIWFRASLYGGTDDRVLWKSVVDEATYRLPDIAYHVTKFERGYDLIIDIFGADHHATYPDVLAGLRALGYDTSRIKVLIHQFVTLIKGGEKVKMSTRKANYVTLDELIDDVGRDVARYFFLMRGMKSHLNFDLDLAKTESEENPVFYLQYAHARICSILRNAATKNLTIGNDFNMALLKEEETLSLLNALGEFQEVIEICVSTLEPQHLTTYLQKVATAFHKFYTVHRVISNDAEVSRARLALVKAVQIVMANGLALLGISAPERM